MRHLVCMNPVVADRKSPCSIAWLLAAITIGACVAGCGASSEQVAVAKPQSLEKPEMIVIYPFAVDADDVTLNQGFFESTYRDVKGVDESAEQHDIAQNSAEDICLEIASELREKGHDAVCQKRGVPITRSALVVDGEFTNLSEGNKLKRMVIGFGAGASAMDTNVDLYHKTNSGSQKILEFNTHADSGRQPGMAVMGPAGAAVGTPMMAVSAANMATKAHRSSFGHLQDRTAEEIVNEITAYFEQHNWPVAS